MNHHELLAHLGLWPNFDPADDDPKLGPDGKPIPVETDAEKTAREAQEKEDKELEALTPGQKAALARAEAAKISQAEARAAQKVKDDAAAQKVKDDAAAERTRKRKEAEESKDPAKILAADRSELEEIRKELEKDRATVKGQVDYLSKVGIAREVGLPNPEQWAKRITGANEAEWKADAESLLKDLGSRATRGNNNNTTNNRTNGNDQQRRRVPVTEGGNNHVPKSAEEVQASARKATSFVRQML